MKELEHLDCFGEERRVEILNNYDIKLVIYAKLLRGQVKRSDARREITDTYYEFQCTLKSDNNVVKAITCGSGAGEHLLELANITKPPIFNPLRNEFNGNHGGGNSIGSQWNKVAKELYNAIRWLICCWDTVPYGKLLEIKESIEHYYYSEPFLKKIIFVNNVISKDKKRRTISVMIDEMRASGNDIREFNFNSINKILKEKDIRSYF